MFRHINAFSVPRQMALPALTPFPKIGAVMSPDAALPLKRGMNDYPGHREHILQFKLSAGHVVPLGYHLPMKQTLPGLRE